MIVFFDTDVLIDLALDRKPFSDVAVKLIDAAENRKFDSFIAWHSISNFYYIVSGSIKKQKVIDFIKDLLQFVNVATTSTNDVLFATSLQLTDFEDSLQVAAAKACKAEVIITRNIKHYKSSPIPVQTPTNFIKKNIHFFK
jgi:predicted nucleic acid-binding protein